MTTKLMFGALALALTAAMPATAQMANSNDHMMAKGDMKMSKSQMAMMKKCQGMSHDMMTKNKKCVSMMKMHPDMMKSDSM